MHKKLWLGNLKRKIPLGRLKHRWEYNIKMYVKEIRCEDVIRFIWLRIGSNGGIL
jgi:hypothetical protein